MKKKPKKDKPKQKEMRRYLGVTVVGVLFALAGTFLLTLPEIQGRFMAAGAAAFGVACAGIGIVQMIAVKRATKPHHQAMAWLAMVFGLACLLIAVGAYNATNADFTLRYPRWSGVIFGSIGALAFGGGGILMLVKGPPK